MPLQLNGQNIETPAGDSGTYTWADVVALNSTNMVQHTDSSGRAIFRWKGVITLRGTSRLNVFDTTIEFVGSSISSPGQIIVLDNAQLYFGELATVGGQLIGRRGCNLLVGKTYYNNTNQNARYAALTFTDGSRLTTTNSRIYLYGSTVSFDDPDKITSFSLGSDKRIDLLFTEARDCIFQGQTVDVPLGLDGCFIYAQQNGGVYNCIGRNIALDASGSLALNNLSISNSPASISSFFVAGRLALRGFNSLGATHDYWCGSYLDIDTAFDFIDSNVTLSNGRISHYGNGGNTPDLNSRRLISSSIRISDSGGNVSGALVGYYGRSTVENTTNASGLTSEFLLVIEETNIAGRTTPASNADVLKPIPVINYSAYVFRVKSYLHQGIEENQTLTAAIGSSTNPFQINVLTDLGVTQTNIATVASYTGISNSATTITLSETRTLAEVYDSRKLYWRNNSNVVSPKFGNGLADFGATNLVFDTNGILNSSSKFTEGLQLSGVVTLNVARTYTIPLTVSTGGSVRVTNGSTDLRAWGFASGTQINNTSASAATVTVAPSQIGSLTVANPTIGGGSITLQTPPQTLRIYGLPTISGTILYVKNFSTNAVSFPTLSNGEATISVTPSTNYELRADSPGYLASRFITVNSGTIDSNVEIALTRILDASSNPLIEQGNQSIANLLVFDPVNLIIEVEYSATYPEIDFASAMLSLEQQLATQQGIQFPAQPIPIILPDRRIIRFVKNGANTNPVRIRPKAGNTGNPTLLFELEHEGSAATPYSLFDFSTANGRVINYPTVLAVAQGGGGSGGLTSGQSAQLGDIHTRTGRVDALIENSGGDRFRAKALETAPTSSGSGLTASDVWSHTTRSLTDKAGFAPSSSDIATAVWSATTRSLTTFGTLTSDVATAVWASTTRSLTTFGTLVSDVATAVWSNTTRSLTTFGTLPNLIWSNSTRTLTTAIPTAEQNAAAVRTELTTELGRLDVAIGSRLAASSYVTPETATTIATAVWNATTRSLTDKTGFALTSSERTAIATAVEAALINEGDGQQLIDAILDVINANLDLPALELTAIAQAVRNELTAELNRIDVAVSSRLADADYIDPPTPPTTSAIALAVQSQLSDEFASVLSAIGLIPAPDNTSIAAIKAKTDAIIISGGDVVATLNGETVALPSGVVEQILRLYQIAGFDAANPVNNSQTSITVAGITLNLTEPAPGIVRIARAS